MNKDAQPDAAKPKRRWYQFSLWSMLVWMAVIGVLLTVGLRWIAPAQQQRAAVQIAEPEEGRDAGVESLVEYGWLAMHSDEAVLPPLTAGAPIRMDPIVLRALDSPDVHVIKFLYDQAEFELLYNLGITTDQSGMTVGEFQTKALAFHRVYQMHGRKRHVFVYDPGVHSWPGFQPETIVICDESYALLDWKEVGGSPFFEEATLVEAGAATPVLCLTRKHRHTIPNPERGIYKFSLADDTIKALAKVEWLYKNDAERAQYDEWRKLLREREGIKKQDLNVIRLE